MKKNITAEYLREIISEDGFKALKAALEKREPIFLENDIFKYRTFFDEHREYEICKDRRTIKAVLARINKKYHCDASVDDSYYYINNFDQFAEMDYKGKKYVFKFYDGCFNPFLASIENVRDVRGVIFFEKDAIDSGYFGIDQSNFFGDYDEFIGMSTGE